MEEKHGVKFAPAELAAQFSMELSSGQEDIDKWIGKSFGFHGQFLCHHYGYSIDELKEEG